jgi:hypothetical protein
MVGVMYMFRCWLSFYIYKMYTAMNRVVRRRFLGPHFISYRCRRCRFLIVTSLLVAHHGRGRTRRMMMVHVDNNRFATRWTNVMIHQPRIDTFLVKRVRARQLAQCITIVVIALTDQTFGVEMVDDVIGASRIRGRQRQAVLWLFVMMIDHGGQLGDFVWCVQTPSFGLDVADTIAELQQSFVTVAVVVAVRTIRRTIRRIR